MDNSGFLGNDDDGSQEQSLSNGSKESVWKPHQLLISVFGSPWKTQPYFTKTGKTMAALPTKNKTAKRILPKQLGPRNLQLLLPELGEDSLGQVAGYIFDVCDRCGNLCPSLLDRDHRCINANYCSWRCYHLSKRSCGRCNDVQCCPCFECNANGCKVLVCGYCTSPRCNSCSALYCSNLCQKAQSLNCDCCCGDACISCATFCGCGTELCGDCSQDGCPFCDEPKCPAQCMDCAVSFCTEICLDAHRVTCSTCEGDACNSCVTICCGGSMCIKCAEEGCRLCRHP